MCHFFICMNIHLISCDIFLTEMVFSKVCCTLHEAINNILWKQTRNNPRCFLLINNRCKFHIFPDKENTCFVPWIDWNLLKATPLKWKLSTTNQYKENEDHTTKFSQCCWPVTSFTATTTHDPQLPWKFYFCIVSKIGWWWCLVAYLQMLKQIRRDRCISQQEKSDFQRQ